MYYDFDVNATLPLKGMLAVLILCHHIGIVYPSDPIGIFKNFGYTLVSVFFFISGYGLMISYKKKGNEYLKNFFRRRLSKLLPTFIVLTLACMAYQCVILHSSLSGIIRDLLRGNPPLPNSWFIYAIIYQYIIFYIACKIGKTQMRCVLIITLLTLSFIALVHAAHFGGWWWVSQPSFVLGIIVAAYEKELVKLLAKYPLFIIVCVCLIAVTALINSELGLAHGGGSIFIFPNLMPILVLFMAYAYGPIKNNIVRYLGNISFEIYLLQGLAILVVESFGFPWHISVICVFALVIPLSEIAHRFSRLVASCL